jgi:hypothetical protein
MRRQVRNLSWAAALIGAQALVTASAQTTLPLVQQSDIAYVGAFALPNWDNGAKYGTSFFEYGGHALTFFKDSSGRRTLYMEGHAQYPGNIGQIEIPATLGTGSSLPTAKVLQNFVSVGGAPDAGSCAGNPSFVYGMLGFGGRLIIADACSYGGSQTTSHGVGSLTLSSLGFKGWYSFSGAKATPRALAGPMTLIPSEWQSAFGGPAFTGNCCISVTNSTSAGPALTVFDPADVGVANPIPGKTVLYYPLTNPVCGAMHCEEKQSSVYNLTTVYGGAAFPSGTRSVLFIMAHGTGSYCYGSASDCGNDTALYDVKGPHAQPYRYQILAYDANDLIAVKNGSKQTYDPKPYGTFVLSGMPNSDDDKIKGAAFDQETGRLYIAQNYSEQPRIEVYQIGTPAKVVKPSPPAVTDVK